MSENTKLSCQLLMGGIVSLDFLLKRLTVGVLSVLVFFFHSEINFFVNAKM